MKGKIIFLNGASSTGKTTLARALQATLDEVYYHLSVDNFVSMIDEKKLESDFIACITDAISIMHHTVRLFSDRGLNVIVDHVLEDSPALAFATPECVALLHDYPVLFSCGWTATLRSWNAGKRNAGTGNPARQNGSCNTCTSSRSTICKFNTARQTTDQCVQAIMRMLDRPEEWTAFRRMYEK